MSLHICASWWSPVSHRCGVRVLRRAPLPSLSVALCADMRKDEGFAPLLWESVTGTFGSAVILITWEGSRVALPPEPHGCSQPLLHRHSWSPPPHRPRWVSLPSAAFQGFTDSQVLELRVGHLLCTRGNQVPERWLAYSASHSQLSCLSWAWSLSSCAPGQLSR